MKIKNLKIGTTRRRFTARIPVPYGGEKNSFVTNKFARSDKIPFKHELVGQTAKTTDFVWKMCRKNTNMYHMVTYYRVVSVFGVLA